MTENFNSTRPADICHMMKNIADREKARLKALGIDFDNLTIEQIERLRVICSVQKLPNPESNSVGG